MGPYLKTELENAGYLVFGLGTENRAEVENYYCADITDSEKIEEVIIDARPDFVFHLAGISSPPFAEENSELTRAVNIEGTRNLLDACLRLSTPPKVLIVGSSHVYGDPTYLPLDEKHPLKGVGVYTQSRIEQEYLAQTYTDRLPLIITRSFNHTGPGQTDTFVVPKIMKQIVEVQKGLRQHMDMGDVTIKLDISHVRDVVQAYRLLLEQSQVGIIVNVCRGESIALKEIIEYGRILAHLNEVPIVVNPALVRSSEMKEIYGSCSLLHSLIDWDLQYDYPSLLADVYHFWNQQII